MVEDATFSGVVYDEHLDEPPSFSLRAPNKARFVHSRQVMFNQKYFDIGDVYEESYF